jgi:hypothetical protein
VGLVRLPSGGCEGRRLGFEVDRLEGWVTDPLCIPHGAWMWLFPGCAGRPPRSEARPIALAGMLLCVDVLIDGFCRGIVGCGAVAPD